MFLLGMGTWMPVALSKMETVPSIKSGSLTLSGVHRAGSLGLTTDLTYNAANHSFIGDVGAAAKMSTPYTLTRVFGEHSGVTAAGRGLAGYFRRNVCVNPRRV